MNQIILGLSKKDKIIFISLILIIASCIVGLQIIPDERPTVIRTVLERYGLCTYDVDFELVANSGFRTSIFQSSAPIFYDGNYITLWRVRRYGLGIGFTLSYRVLPYLPDE